MKKSLALIGMTLLALTACQPNTDGQGDGESSASSQGTVTETRNVSYRGTLEAAGITIFMEGTHKLQLDDGRMILLESTDIDLSDYVDLEVEVFGTVRPTVETGGMIMRVERVTSLNASSDAASSPASMSGALEAATSSAESEAMQPSSAAAASSIASIQAASSVAAVQTSDELTAKVELMAKVNMDAGNWTQEYCSSHVHFCIPVHRNWWYVSFGATSSSFWHVEIGPSEIFNLGDGPLVVALVSGSLTSAGATDGQVMTQNGTSVGYRAWDDNRHFEVRGPAMLESAIRYITEQLKKTQG